MLKQDGHLPSWSHPRIELNVVDPERASLLMSLEGVIVYQARYRGFLDTDNWFLYHRDSRLWVEPARNAHSIGELLDALELSGRLLRSDVLAGGRLNEEVMRFELSDIDDRTRCELIARTFGPKSSPELLHRFAQAQVHPCVREGVTIQDIVAFFGLALPI